MRTCRHCLGEFEWRSTGGKPVLCPGCAEHRRWCPGCNRALPHGDFHANRRRCKPCAREYTTEWRRNNKDKVVAGRRRRHLMRLYGLSTEAYEAMFAEQGGKCAICRRPPSGALHVDHDHETGAVRSLLCSDCNTGLGLFQEAPALLRAAEEYLLQHQGLIGP